MALVEVQVDREIRRRLARPVLTWVREHLWAGDCQTCVQPLRGATPSLVVDDMGDRARATLHHPRCRASQWNTSNVIPVTAGRTLTTTTQALLFRPHEVAYLTREPPAAGEEPRTLAGVVINPGIEAVELTRHQHGWSPDAPSAFKSLGLTPPRDKIDPTVPLAGATAHVLGGQITVQLAAWVYSAPTLPPITEAIERHQGLVVLMTSALNTSDTALTLPALYRLMRSGDVALGWVRYAGDPTAPDTTTPSAAALEHLLDPHPLPIAAPGDDEPLTAEPWTGSTYDRATGTFRLGRSAAGPVPWTLNRPGTGVAHGVITGPRGCGKTTTLKLILTEAAASGCFTVAVADPLDRGLAALLAQAGIPAATTVADTLELLDTIAAQVLADPEPVPDPDPVNRALLVVIDDADAVLGHTRAAAHARTIAEHGGPRGVGLIIATSSLDPGDLGGSTRLLAALAETNALAMSPDHHHFLQQARHHPRPD